MSLPAFAQPKKLMEPLNAPPANGGPITCGPSSNYYSKSVPCAYTYNVPAERLADLLNANRYCTMYSRTQVNCAQPVKGDYGQIQLDQRDGAVAPRGSTAPPEGVPPAQRGQADQLWQRAASLVDQRSFSAAMPLLLQGGRLGDVRAQTMLGIVYQDGDGLRADDKTAASWYAAAAAQGNRAAQYALGGLYRDGAGIAKDLAKAADLFTKSANQGFTQAQVALGVAYELGQGVTRSRPQAIQWLERAGGPQGWDVASHLAVILRLPETPARFADADALENYLVAIHNLQITNGPALDASTPAGMARGYAEKEFAAWLSYRGLGSLRNCRSQCVQ